MADRTVQPQAAPSRALSGLLRPSAALPPMIGATLLVTELVGYAEREARLPDDALARLLHHHDERVLPAIRAFHGRRVRSRRETVLAAFTSPTNAVLCAMAIQDRLASDTGAGEPLAVRVGVHLGESRPEGGDLVGEAVELALAVRAVAEPGAIALSRTVVLAMNRSEVAVEPAGAVPHPRRDEPLPVYGVERAPGPLPYGGREAARVEASERVTRVLAPLADGLASIEEGAAEGRVRAALRVGWAAAGLVSLRLLEAATRGAAGGVAVVSWAGYRRGATPPSLARAAARLERALQWARLRRSVHRAALTRPLR